MQSPLNVTAHDQHRADIQTLLKRDAIGLAGGTVLCLEFGTPQAWLRPLYDWYSRHIIPRLGSAVTGRREAYRYLVDSIRAFPDHETLKGQMQEAGFTNVRYRTLSFGIAAAVILWAHRPQLSAVRD